MPNWITPLLAIALCIVVISMSYIINKMYEDYKNDDLDGWYKL